MRRFPRRRGCKTNRRRRTPMAIVDRTKLLARPEVKKAIAKVRRTLRAVLSGGSFGEREVEALTISGEAVREVLREDLQAIADSATSSIRPRQGKRGWSSMVAAGAPKPAASRSTSCRKVSMPRNRSEERRVGKEC